MEDDKRCGELAVAPRQAETFALYLDQLSPRGAWPKWAKPGASPGGPGARPTPRCGGDQVGRDQCSPAPRSSHCNYPQNARGGGEFRMVV